MAGTARKNDPALWDRVKATVMAGDKGGAAGQWSARKAQLAVAEYKKAGGTYAGPKQADNHLGQWTREDWGTGSGKPSGETGERYLPTKARAALSDDEYRRTSAKKRRDSAAGEQFSRQPADVAAKVAEALDNSHRQPGTGARRPRMNDERTAAWREFLGLVNIPAATLRDWLETKESRGVGWTHEGEEEAVGHQSGRRILELIERDDAPSDAADVAFLSKVVGYVRRHLAQRPDGDVGGTRWRYSLMNWGHDPLRNDGSKTADSKPKRRAPARGTRKAGNGTTKPVAKRVVAGAAKPAAAPPRKQAAGTAKARSNGTAARRASDATPKREAGEGAKRPPAAATKHAVGTTAKQSSATKGTTARRPAGPAARTAVKGPADGKREPASAKSSKRPNGDAAKPGATKRGSRADGSRDAAGPAKAAAKGGRSRNTER